MNEKEWLTNCRVSSWHTIYFSPPLILRHIAERLQGRSNVLPSLSSSYRLPHGHIFSSATKTIYALSSAPKGWRREKRDRSSTSFPYKSDKRREEPQSRLPNTERLHLVQAWTSKLELKLIALWLTRPSPSQWWPFFLFVSPCQWCTTMCTMWRDPCKMRSLSARDLPRISGARLGFDSWFENYSFSRSTI